MKCRTKSRAGCRTCKIKRLKCGEEAPQCRNCVSKGAQCPGYQKDLKWSTKYESRRGALLAEPVEFDQLVSAASKSICARSSRQGPSREPHRAKEKTVINAVTEIDGNVLPNEIIHTEQKYNSDLFKSPKLGGQHPDRAPSPPPSDEHYQIAHRPNLCQTLTQPSTRLVELWFKSVCGVWSAFDSPANPFRRLCSSLWGSSEVVFYSLQSMASTSLTTEFPDFKEATALAPRLANQALIQELQTLFKAPKDVSSVPAGLLIALFCMSSSCSWVDSRELGLQYLGNARVVLDLLELNLHYLHEEDRQLLGFFRGCLVYEQMLRGIVSNREEDINVLLEWNATDLTLDPLDLHPWTGVSTGIVMLLGKAMALCRRSRDLWRHRPVATCSLMLQALHDMAEGQQLEERLLSIEVPNKPEESDSPQSDEESVRVDLYNATEAFRLSSLLQLYQSFPDLLSRRLPSDEAEDNQEFQSQWVAGLAVRISKVIEGIPPTSPMRCLQPLLCVCAGSGLRHESGAGPEASFKETRPTIDQEEHASPQDLDAASIAHYQDSGSLEVAQARNFLLSRLNELDQGILSNSVTVAKQLLVAIWTAFDRASVVQESHWMDVMAGTRSWTPAATNEVKLGDRVLDLNFEDIRAEDWTLETSADDSFYYDIAPAYSPNRGVTKAFRILEMVNEGTATATYSTDLILQAGTTYKFAFFARTRYVPMAVGHVSFGLRTLTISGASDNAFEIMC
ncbi:hypothetical protein QQZ08_006874 [Neonectria magnoliae]|uniref:Zn(2)-C6 fungal-type domain-containing protein n=1 Tax=Neonectria magnoliae TaxID=2732573 RepID=A0ABR1I047_9HYPO